MLLQKQLEQFHQRGILSCQRWLHAFGPQHMAFANTFDIRYLENTK